MSEQTGFSSAVIVAGGSGSRMGRPKQMLPLGAKPVLVRTVEAFLQTPEIKEIVVVTPSENRAELQKRFPGIVFADPGKTRLLSVKNGFLKTSAASQLVAVHDGARPLVEPAHISA